MREAGFPDKLHTLLTEVTALAHQLRKTTAKLNPPDGCPHGVLSLLRVLDHQGPQTVPGIARARGLSRQNVQVLVNRLRARGLVTLGQNPAHKRSALVHLTTDGQAFLAAASREELQSTEALLPYITESRLVPAATLLRQLRQLLGGAQPPEPPLPRRVAISSSAESPRKRVRRKRPGPAATEMPPPEPTEPEEDEFPVNLL
jgi:DNA-binding MarR family transcriptional regulator